MLELELEHEKSNADCGSVHVQVDGALCGEADAVQVDVVANEVMQIVSSTTQQPVRTPPSIDALWADYARHNMELPCRSGRDAVYSALRNRTMDVRARWKPWPEAHPVRPTVEDMLNLIVTYSMKVDTDLEVSVVIVEEFRRALSELEEDT